MLGAPWPAALKMYRACKTPPVAMFVSDIVPAHDRGTLLPKVNMTPVTAALRERGPLATPSRSEQYAAGGVAPPGLQRKYARLLNSLIHTGGDASVFVRVFCVVYVSAATVG